MNRDGFLSVSEAAKRLGTTRRRARRWLLAMAARHPETRLLVVPASSHTGWLWVDFKGVASVRRRSRE